MNKKRLVFFGVWRVLVIGFSVGALLSSASSFAGTAGQVTHLSGTLSAKQADGSSKLLSVRSDVREGDLLTTEVGTYARVKFVDGAEIVLRPGSQLKVDTYRYVADKPQSDNIFVSLIKGGLRAVTGLVGKRSRDSVNFATATATIGIRGTHFGVLFCQDDCAGVPTVSGKTPENGVHVDVADGAVLMHNEKGQQQIGAGQFGYARDAGTPPAIVPPKDGVQVTMPASISQNDAGSSGVGASGGRECVAR